METESLKSYAPLGPMDESSLDVNTSYAQILHFIEGSPKVVDFGCGPGNLARFLTQRGCSVVGVEINADSASLAREYCSDVLIADLDNTSPLKLFPNERFDVAIFADILEHLRKPERLLAEVARILRPGGYVIASIPNIAHGAIRLAMLRGEFDYQELGILDETHLRFYTRKTMEKLFEESGFFIQEMRRTTAPVFEPTGTLVPANNRADFSDDVAQKIESDAEAETVQFIVKAIPAASSEARYEANKRKVSSLSARIVELEEQLKSAQTELAEKLDAPTREHFEHVQNELHAALLGPEGLEALRAQLQQRNEELEKLRAQETAFAAREESTGRREKKLAEENKKAAASIAELGQRIESYEAAARARTVELEKATQQLSERSAEVERLRAELAQQIESSESAARARSEELETARRQLTARSADVEALRADLAKQLKAYESAAQARVEELEAASRQLSERSAEVESLRIELGAAAAANKKSAGSVEQLKNEIQQMRGAVKAAELAFTDASGTIEEQKSAIAALTVDLAATHDDITQARMRARSLATLHKSSEAQRVQLNAEIDDLRDECGQARRFKAEARQEIETLRTELTAREALRQALEQRALEAERKFGEAVSALEKLRAEANEELEAVRTELVETQHEHGEALSLIEELRVTTLVQLDEMRTALHARERERDAIKDQVLELSQQCSDSRSELQQAQARIDELNERKDKLETLYEETDSHRRDLSDQLDALRSQHMEAALSHAATAKELQRVFDEMIRAQEMNVRASADLERAAATSTELRTRCERNEFYLREMRKSKFWQLRNGWFSLKRAFGITTDIP